MLYEPDRSGKKNHGAGDLFAKRQRGDCGMMFRPTFARTIRRCAHWGSANSQFIPSVEDRARRRSVKIGSVPVEQTDPRTVRFISLSQSRD